MINSYDVILKLIDRYDYGGALELLNQNDLDESDVAIIIDSCRYAINFDFKTARYLINQISDGKKKDVEIVFLKKNLEDLIYGESGAIFSELIANIEFQIVNEEYIDFLGRVYRFKEAILKYIFVSKNLNRDRFSFHFELMNKRSIMKILRKRYKIFNSNLIYALDIYFNKYLSDDYNVQKVKNIMNSSKMDNLMDLRNNSIVGHGFVGVSVDDIHRLYGNPYNVIDDFIICLNLIDINLVQNKYVRLNDFIRKELLEINEAL